MPRSFVTSRSIGKALSKTSRSRDPEGDIASTSKKAEDWTKEHTKEEVRDEKNRPNNSATAAAAAATIEKAYQEAVTSMIRTIASGREDQFPVPSLEGHGGRANAQERQHRYKDAQGSSWNGCNMACLNGGTTDSLVELANFINAIHTWGEGEYASGFMKDIATLYSPSR